MSTFSADPVAEVRSRADIVEIIGSSVVLKRSGRNFTGLCPFHQERSPSFNVNPERQIFRCFGCGEGGDVFSFLMKHQHMTFPEALKSLADRYGVVLPDRRPEDDDKQLLREANEQAAGFYQRTLAHPEFGAKARAYLEARGVDEALQRQFGIGYAPPQWDGLHRYLMGASIAPAIQERAALTRARANGGHYDYFRNRIMFPIHNEGGQVVGFGARALEPDDEPKYLNSPETPLYHKGQLLYGLNQARESIRKADCAVLMEGYMDVITAHAYGFTNAIGVLGTALTPGQARVLLRYTPGKRVVVAFDADRAGQLAAERGLSTLGDVTQGVGLDARVLVVPEGKDPDAYLRNEGADAFTRLLEQAPTLYAFLIDRAIGEHDTLTAEGRTKAVSAVVPILRTIGNYVTQDDYVKRVSQRLGLREESLRLEISRGLRHNVAPSRGGPPPGVTPGNAPSTKKLSSREAERLLLYFMVEQASVRERVREQLAAIVFEPLHQTLRERIEESGDGPVAWVDLLTPFAGDAEFQKVISALMFEEFERWATEPVQVVEDCISTLESHYWEGELGRLSERMKRESENPDANLQRQLADRHREIGEYCMLLKKKRSHILAPSQQTPEEN